MPTWLLLTWGSYWHEQNVWSNYTFGLAVLLNAWYVCVRADAKPDGGNVSTTEDLVDWNASPLILVAVTRRNEDTYDTFMRALEDRCLKAVNLSKAVQQEVPQQLYYAFRDLVQLLQIVSH